MTLTFDDCDPQVDEPDQRPRSPSDSLVVDNDSTDNARFRHHITSVVVARSGETGSKSKRNNERIRNPETGAGRWLWPTTTTNDERTTYPPRPRPRPDRGSIKTGVATTFTRWLSPLSLSNHHSSSDSDILYCSFQLKTVQISLVGCLNYD